MRKIVAFLFVCFSLASCKKECLPQLPEDTGSYYSIHGLMDGDSVDLNVGQDGVIMKQGVSSLNGVQTFYGQILSPSADLSIKIEFIRPEKTNTSIGHTAFDQNQLSFLIHESSCIDLGFGNNQDQLNYLLVKNSQGDFQPINQLVFDEFGIYDITMKFTDFSENTFTLPIKYGYDNLLLNSDFKFITANGLINLEPVITEGTHQWLIDGNLISNDETCSIEVGPGIYLVEHVLKDQDLNESSQSALVRMSNYSFDWVMNVDPCPYTNNSNYGKVILTIESKGETYRSDKASVNLNNQFSVSNEAYFIEDGIDRVVFDFVFDAFLINENHTDSLALESMKGTFNIGL